MLISEDNVKDMCERILEEVQEYHYYENRCDAALKDMEQKNGPKAKWTPVQWGEWAQTFWELLPDSPSIRTQPFFLLCDVAEWFCFGDDPPFE